MTDGFYMDAVITPARSLSRIGRRWVLGISLALAAIPTMIFTLALRTPFILPFMGLDLAGLALALWWVNRKAVVERVRISRETIEVIRDDVQVWRSQLAFTRIQPVEAAVSLTGHGKSYRLAAALSPHERTEFTAALQLAVIAARAGSSAARQRPKPRS